MAMPGQQEGMFLIWTGVSLGVLVAAAAGVLFRRKTKVFPAEVVSAIDARANGSSGGGVLGPMSIYFGSQTGTAEGFAKSLAQEAERKGFASQVIDLEDFDPEQLASAERAVFMMATYGEGDPTDNAAAFMQYLKEAEDSDDKRLANKGLKFTVFGLGNRQYEHFNRTGRMTDAGLAAAGAARLFPYGEGDDDGTLEDDFESWKDRFWTAVGPVHSADERKTSMVASATLPFKLRYLTEEDAAAAAPCADSEAASSTRFYWQAKVAKVTANRELKSTGAQGSTRHIEVDLTDTGLQYETADNMAVLPENPRAAVEQLARCQGYDLNATIALDYADGHKPVFPNPCTVRDVLTRYLDICGVPRKPVVERLLLFAPQKSIDRARLMQLLSKEGRDEYKSFVTEPRRTLAELLYKEFKAVKIPLHHFIAMVPPLQPRDYTIASSSSVHPSTAHLTVAVLQSEHGSGHRYTGVCTAHLSALTPAAAAAAKAQCRVFVRQSTFRLPADNSRPIIMIGPGTGIAPMRALLQERKHRRASGKNLLYFGCRNPAHDYLYKHELEALLSEGTLHALRLAFSRQPDTQKVYVQDRLREHAQETWQLLSQDTAYLYVCGGTAMGADIQTALTDICVTQGGLSHDAAKGFLKTLHAEGRYVQELWS